ncbi:hypothetical protein C7212DRAFT_277963 [Tuber magnatum]|uniref:BRCT domain-containing protein n=1 Tax=Tuber magnatum TaxID=42249 RepID=A0A317SVL8_9PEZI|nr:hypothetical protein C7212DRAFT_277963 [Tuber magnatum]
MLVSLTVGKVDAGLAILLTEEKRLIEFPSVLLPPGIASGSIVDIQISQNTEAEDAAREAFHSLQEEIYNLYGIHSPSKPVLRVRNATQTSVVLEWDPVQLATATLRNLTLYRNNSKAGAIPNPTTHTSTKISGLALDTEYSFHLVLRTSAGTYSSEKLTVRTHKMTDLSGITVCPGVMPGEAREELETTLQRIGAKSLQDFVRIDTTHFVCTEGRGQNWERAQEMNIPVVRPEWLHACEKEGRIVGVRQFYLGADVSRMRQGLQQQGSRPQQQQHRPTQNMTESPATTPIATLVAERRDSRHETPPVERRETRLGSTAPVTRHEEEEGEEDTKKGEDKKGGPKEDQKEEEAPSEHSADEDAPDTVTLDNGKPTPTPLGPETLVTDTGNPEEGFEEVRL